MPALLRRGLGSLLDSLRDLAPIVTVVALFQLAVLGQPIPNLADLLIGTLMVVTGLSLFVQGLKLGLFPVGEHMAWDLARKGSLIWLLASAFALGFDTTVADRRHRLDGHQLRPRRGRREAEDLFRPEP